ncbi:acylphosphatase [Caminibacter pacificus]|uniref:acylphosphatase n=1 Tax=Caminibacter pacificus TaxID=1424653 RepID=A0AAJ4RDU9_9BACT|nr:acylphosphatase [Caminibacter pacificus]NPA88263.1 acylphosphatase [Campylobacterota bacterium]QCI28361.1 acylphosphatase [Caminibacter pacificus]ROR40918.1 acylphosphatase [Caminibacter pacificus]
MTYKFLISGKVQGVWYRKFVSENAKKAGFKGYVKNLDDGRVEAVANIENEERFKEFIDILKKGSPYSHVEHIEYQEIPEIEFRDFEIRY